MGVVVVFIGADGLCVEYSYLMVNYLTDSLTALFVVKYKTKMKL